jgi:hypothetical protein
MNESRIPFKISDNIFYIISQFNAYSKISKKQSKKRIENVLERTYSINR